MRLAVLFLIACPAFCGYAYKGTVTFAAASGSTTDTNITLAFTGSDAKLKTAGNGGQIQHTVTRVGVTVPADFVLTNDTTCASLTGSWTWGIETYSATGGTIIGWAKVASLTTGASVVPTVCVGNSAVSTYQGGAAGSEFDGNTQVAAHFPDGTTLNANDFSSNAFTASTNTATAVAGIIDGASAYNGSESIVYSARTTFTGSITMEIWVYPTGAQYSNIFGQVGANNDWALTFWGGGNILAVLGANNLGTFTCAYTVNAWNYIVITLDTVSANFKVYLNGSLLSTTSEPAVAAGSTSGSFPEFGNGGLGGLSGSLDEGRVSSVARSGDWLATEYANQLSPPAISALTPLAGATGQPFIF